MQVQSAHADQLLQKIESQTARIGIVGLGYVGLPLAVEFAKQINCRSSSEVPSSILVFNIENAPAIDKPSTLV